MVADMGAVDHEFLAGFVGGVEGNLVENALHHRAETAGADILDIRVPLDRNIGNGLDGVAGEVEVDAFGLHQRDILPDQASLRLGEDAAEIVAGEGAELDTNGEPTLQFPHYITLVR